MINFVPVFIDDEDDESLFLREICERKDVISDRAVSDYFVQDAQDDLLYLEPKS
jgi:hypothetical protein